jgi:hypothetical protein
MTQSGRCGWLQRERDYSALATRERERSVRQDMAQDMADMHVVRLAKFLSRASITCKAFGKNIPHTTTDHAFIDLRVMSHTRIS